MKKRSINLVEKTSFAQLYVLLVNKLVGHGRINSRFKLLI